MIISVKDFSGMMPILSPYRIPNNLAQDAVDCKFVNGDLTPFKSLKGPITSFPYGTKSIYRYDDRLWITSRNHFNIVPSTIINDVTKRIYKTEEWHIPEMSFNTQIDADNWFSLGVPTPSHGPTASSLSSLKSGTITKILSQTEFDSNPNQNCGYGTCGTTGVGPLVCFTSAHGLESGNRVKIRMSSGMTFLDGRTYSITKVDDNHFSLVGSQPTQGFPFQSSGSWSEYRDESEKENRAYCYTFVTDQGEEGPPSPLTTTEVYSDASVQLTDIASDGSNGNFSFFSSAVKRIYRSVTSATGTNLHFIGEIPFYNTGFLDDIDPSEIGEPIPSESWDMPPEDMQGLVTMPNGILAGFSGRDICFSVSFMPHAWPIEYRLNVDSDIVALGVFGQSMVVATKERPYIVTGTDSSSMTLEKMEINQSCVSNRGLVDMGVSVIYPSPDGLIDIQRGSVSNITKPYFSRYQWQFLEPESMLAFSYEGKYMFSVNEATFLFDNSSPTITKLSGKTIAAYNDLEKDTLYVLQDNELYQFDSGDYRSNYRWRSKKFRMPRPISMSCAQVIFDPEDNPPNGLSLSIWADGQLVVDHKQLTDANSIIRLPSIGMAEDWEFELEGFLTVHSVSIATDIKDLRDNV